MHNRAMRTTIDISEDHRLALNQISQMRGYRGYSKIIQEAIDYFIAHNPFDRRERIRLLRLKGAWKQDQSKETRARLSEVRNNWKD
jgi:metal-responsive CopG/Arc/MetJ family transcriptional regulator